MGIRAQNAHGSDSTTYDGGSSEEKGKNVQETATHLLFYFLKQNI